MVESMTLLRLVNLAESQDSETIGDYFHKNYPNIFLKRVTPIALAVTLTQRGILRELPEASRA